jgi:hypothetical protein
MKQDNSLNYICLTTTISELNKIGAKNLAEKLQHTLLHNELPKPNKHNRQADKTTSFYKIILTADELESIVDLFYDLEVKYLDENYETTGATSSYADMADSWSHIEPAT